MPLVRSEAISARLSSRPSLTYSTGVCTPGSRGSISLHRDRTPPRSLPSVYTRSLSTGAVRRLWRRAQTTHDPVAGFGRIDDLNDFQHGSHGDRPSVFIKIFEHCF